MKKKYCYLLLCSLLILSCSKKYNPIGCWKDQDEATISIMEGGSVTCFYKYTKVTIPGKWMLLSDNTLNLEWDYQRRTQTFKITNIENGLMFFGTDDFKFSWKQVECK